MSALRFAGDGFRPFTMKLIRFTENVQDAEPMFQRAADHMATVFAAQFETGGRRMGGGRAWKHLSPKYAAQKAKKYPGQPLMVATGDLRSSLAFRPFGIDEITSKRMIIGTQIKYAAYHQKGAGNLPQRKLIGRLQTSDNMALSTILHDHVMKGVTV